MDTNKIRKSGDEYTKLSQILKIPFVMSTASKANGNERFKEVYESKVRQRKLRTGIMAALLMMLILLTGTYAWTQFNNVGFNAVDVGTNFGGRLHNSMEARENWGIGEYDQNVFVENFGDNRIFVRVRLREFMSTTAQGIPLIEGTSINHPNGLGDKDGTEGNYRP